MRGHQLDKTQAGMDSVHFRENQFQGKTGARSLVHDLFSVYTSEFQWLLTVPRALPITPKPSMHRVFIFGNYSIFIKLNL
jgi:hypothetical protein